ncbi:MAG: DUF1365 domain-containing protein [Verrucomicrobiota bacterium]
MNSCLYECSVMHHRFVPKVHHFDHRIFMFYLDLDELDVLAKKNLLFSHNRKNLYSFRDDDHEPAGQSPLKERVLALLRRTGIDLGPRGRVCLLTLPRVLGYIFNPISIYYCFDGAGKAICSLVEVGNTFREIKLYLLGQEQLAPDATFRKVMPKHFYVSPFSSLTLSFDFKLKVPGDDLDIKIDDRDGDEKTLASALSGRRVELTNPALFGFTLKYPLITAKVVFLIHYQALRLWLKRVPFYRKAEDTSMQREVLRPHPTLASETK